MVGPLGKLGMQPSKTQPFKVATIHDIPELLLLCEEAHKESPHGLRFDKEQVFSSIHQLISQGVIICLLDSQKIVGVFGGLVTLTPMSLEKVGAELLWYVLPAHRKSKYALKLMDAFEYWAYSQKCSAVTVSNMTNNSFERVGKVYERKGYRLVEQSYIKSLKG